MTIYQCSKCGHVNDTADYGDACQCNSGWYDQPYVASDEAADEAREKRVMEVFMRYRRAVQRLGVGGNVGPANHLLIAATLSAAHFGSSASVKPPPNKAAEALAPFAALLTAEGRAPFQLDSFDSCTTEGRPFDDSSDDAQIALRLRVGDIRAAANCFAKADGSVSQ